MGLSALIFLPAIVFPQVGTPNVRQGLAPIVNIGIQDTTKHPQDKKQPAPGSEIQRLPPRISSKSGRTAGSGALSLFDFRDHQFPELTIDVIDSLGKLYPELKDYMLQQAAIQGVLQIDLAERERKKLLDRAFADLRIPNELESKLRRNQALYGTTENPMRPPPPPNQVNLFDVITAVSNLLHYLGVK
ncbi:MAG: hypothetical protein ABSE41_18015 [Bacteroidota bacterium]|jgi:hypothetical protein